MRTERSPTLSAMMVGTTVFVNEKPDTPAKGNPVFYFHYPMMHGSVFP